LDVCDVNTHVQLDTKPLERFRGFHGQTRRKALENTFPTIEQQHASFRWFYAVKLVARARVVISRI
jgi:hypothetical protein